MSRRGWYVRRPDGWAEVALAGAIAGLYLLLLLSTVDGLGYARDEGFYFQAAERYQAWFELLWRDQQEALRQVDRYWRINAEHPALIKSLFALSHLLFWDKWRIFALEGTSFRFPAMALSSLAVGLVYLWGARARGRMVGLVASASLASMPRFFFHAHLACFDGPVVTTWLACAYCYWRAVQRGGWGRYLLVGLTFGLALNSKHNSWFLPIVCGLHALALELPGLAAGIERGVARRRALLALGAMALLGPLVFYAGWPWIWHHTVERLTAYARFHLEHVYYNMEYLARNYWRPPMPRSYAFLMTAATVPTVTLVAWASGVVCCVRRDWWPPLSGLGRRLLGARVAPSEVAAERESALAASGIDPATSALWLLAMAVQYAAWLSPTTPIFGGTKHWMTAYPFLALIAGVGVAALAQGARSAWLRRADRDRRAGGRSPSANTPTAAAPRDSWLGATLRGPLPEHALLAAVLLGPAVQAGHAHPWGLTSYTPLVGGAAGAANLGLNRGFWGYTTGSLVAYLNAEVPIGGRVYVHDTARPAWEMLKRDRRIRPDIRGVWNVAAADFGLYHHEKHMSGEEYQAWLVFGTTAPAHVAGLDGVPVIWVYRRP